MRIADPRPGFCSCCYAGTDITKRYVDFEVAYDGMPVLDPETRTIAILPWNGDQPSHDDLYLCETCLRQATELMGLKPELHARQLREIRRLELERDHWRDYARRQEQVIQERPIELQPPRRGPGRPRKEAVA